MSNSVIRTFTLLVIAVVVTALRPIANRHVGRHFDPTALGAIVGEWQSDTTSGVSARSSCVWTPQRSGVLCEQRIFTPGGASTALNLFAPDTANATFVLYVLSHPGSALAPVSFSIRGNEWIYGGAKAETDGTFYRTVNDFSHIDSYEWRQEMSKNGKDWTIGIHGHVRRVR